LSFEKIFPCVCRFCTVGFWKFTTYPRVNTVSVSLCWKTLRIYNNFPMCGPCVSPTKKNFQKISKNRSLLHFQNFFLERTSSMIQFWYWGWNRQHPCFQTHQQLYQYYTHNRLDLLPKWLHESKIPKSEKVNFSIFMVSPIESSVQRESSSHPYYQIFSGRIP